jgi:hypothetical protein
MAGKAIAQTVTVVATASEGNKDGWDNVDMAELLWLRQRSRKVPENQEALAIISNVAANHSQPSIAAQ